MAAAIALRTAEAVKERPVASTTLPSGPYRNPTGSTARSEDEAIKPAGAGCGRSGHGAGGRDQLGSWRAHTHGATFATLVAASKPWRVQFDTMTAAASSPNTTASSLTATALSLTATASSLTATASSLTATASSLTAILNTPDHTRLDKLNEPHHCTHRSSLQSPRQGGAGPRA